MIRVIAAALVLVVASCKFAQDARLYEPEVAIQNDDYAVARRNFHTTLLRKGPAPQNELAPAPPNYVEEVEYPSGELRLKAWISGHKQNGVKLPAVLFLHGGFAFGFADWDMALPYWENGFVVMVPMLRGENGQAGTFSFFYDEVDDVLAAADYLTRQPSVDPARIYLAGHSSGATLTLLTVEASGRFRAAASFDGSTDQQLLYNGSASKPGVHPEIVFDPKNLRELQVRSPLAYALSLKSPTRLYYSDEASSIIQKPTDRFVQLTKAKGLDVEAKKVRGTHMSHVPAAMQQSIRFFKQTLGAESAALLVHRTVPPRQPSLKGNTTFTLKGFPRAHVVALAGSFNGWDSQHVICGKASDAWICRVNLPPGRYQYQFVVDDDWIPDPDNPMKETADGGGTASVIIKN